MFKNPNVRIIAHILSLVLGMFLVAFVWNRWRNSPSLHTSEHEILLSLDLLIFYISMGSVGLIWLLNALFFGIFSWVGELRWEPWQHRLQKYVIIIIGVAIIVFIGFFWMFVESVAFFMGATPFLLELVNFDAGSVRVPFVTAICTMVIMAVFQLIWLPPTNAASPIMEMIKAEKVIRKQMGGS